MTKFTKKDAAELRRLNRKILGGRGATRHDVDRALQLRRRRDGWARTDR